MQPSAFGLGSTDDNGGWKQGTTFGEEDLPSIEERFGFMKCVISENIR